MAERHGQEESRADELDRNWNELLQELRVVQTGVQILTGFLLTVPFASGFERLSENQKVLYVCILGAAVIATSLLVAPVAFHRIVFRAGAREWLITASHVCARLGIATLGATIVGVVYLIFGLVLGTTVAIVGSVLATVLFATLWFAVPMFVHHK